MTTARDNLKIVGLDSLRFVMALWVVLHHNGGPLLLGDLDINAPPGSWAALMHVIAFCGPAAVMVFFVISGLCIHYPYRNGPPGSWLGYYLSRYLRIGLPLLVALQLSHWLDHQYRVFEQAILWSLYAELIYYTLYPGLMALRRRLGWGWLLAIAFACALGVVLLINPRAVWYPSYGLGFNWLLGLPIWLLGCKLAEELGRQPVTIAPIWAWRLGMWLASGVCVVLRVKWGIGYPYTLTLFAVLAYFWLQQEIAHYRKRPAPRLLEWAGGFSYSLYLTHVLFGTLSTAMSKLPVLPFLARGAAFLSMLVLCYVFYLLIERPAHLLARRLKQGLLPPRRPPADESMPGAA